MQFDRDEIYMMKRARVALLLHQPFSVVDEMSEFECDLIIEMHQAQNELEAWSQKRAMHKMRR